MNPDVRRSVGWLVLCTRCLSVSWSVGWLVGRSVGMSLFSSKSYNFLISSFSTFLFGMQLSYDPVSPGRVFFSYSISISHSVCLSFLRKAYHIISYLHSSYATLLGYNALGDLFSFHTAPLKAPLSACLSQKRLLETFKDSE